MIQKLQLITKIQCTQYTVLSTQYTVLVSGKWKMNTKRPTCPVGSIPSKAGTPKNRVWRHTRTQIFTNDVAAAHTAHAGAIIPVGTTVSVHGFRPSPFSIIPVYCSRYPTQCQGKGAFVYNSFTNFIQTRKKAVHPEGWTAWSGGQAHAFFVRDKAGKRATMV